MSRINTNIPSIQAFHNLLANQADMNIRLERLSTGLRINRGRDDPAGLIASETLRSEITTISQALNNSQRAINVITTAEGALNEVSSLLLELRGLVNHAANQGAINDTELQADQTQVDSLLQAIDRIANTTQFGGEKLINGNFGYTLSGIATSAVANATVFGARVPDNGTQNVTVQVATSAQTAVVGFTGSGIGTNLTIEVRGNGGALDIALTSGSSAQQIVNAINQNTSLTGVSATISGAGVNTEILFHSTTYGADSFVSVKPLNEAWDGIGAGTEVSDYGRNAVVLINGQAAATDGLTASLRGSGLDVKLEMTADFATRLSSSNFYITGGGATFQIGPEVNVNGQVEMGIPSVSTSNLGNATLGFLSSLKQSGVNALTSGNHGVADAIVKEAINQVAVIRGRLGALQRNQIETNVNSQRVALENVQAAESAIRDADIAEEVAALTRSQILVQSTQSILGLANQLPQSVLALLG